VLQFVQDITYNRIQKQAYTNPTEFEIKDRADTARSASYLDLHLEIDSEGWLKTKLYDDF
jgi:hypothetical protein